ncbi:MAG: YraN family protein, partial [Bacteroidetes bacterium CG_4_10_14_3_um_filter_31_20]
GQYLENKGYIVLYKNWRFKHKEVDIICKDKSTLVFVEVKTRTSDYFQKPYEAVQINKQNLLADAAEAFICDYTDFDDLRFDIVSIIFEKNIVKEVEHIKEAFIPGLNS